MSQLPQVLLLSTDWPGPSEKTSITLNTNKAIARVLSHTGANVFCTVPHFQFNLSSVEYQAKVQDGNNHGVKLVGAAFRGGPTEYPDATWITDYWRQYYHDAIRHGGYNNGFTHIIAYVPDTYHSALDIKEEYKDDGIDIKVILIITDTDHENYSTKDREIIDKAHKVFVLGPQLFCDYHELQNKIEMFVPMPGLLREAIASDAIVCKDNALLSHNLVLKLVTVWPNQTNIVKHDMEGLAEVAKALHAFSRCRFSELHQRVHWEIRDVPSEIRGQSVNVLKAVKEITAIGGTRNELTIDVNTNGSNIRTENYSLYISPLRKHPFDLNCLHALQQGLPVFLYTTSGLGDYLKHRSDVLGNATVQRVLVETDGMNDTKKWEDTLRPLNNMDNSRSLLDNARKLSENLTRATDSGWQSLLSQVQSDARVCPSVEQNATVPGSQFQPTSYQQGQTSPGTLSGEAWSTSSGLMVTTNQIAQPCTRDIPERPIKNQSIEDQRRKLETLSVKGEQPTVHISRSWEEVFTEKSLMQLASKLGKDMHAVALYLDLKTYEVDRFIEDNTNNTVMAAHCMLLHFRNSSPLHKKAEQIEKLLDALKQSNRHDLIEEVAGPQPEKPVARNDDLARRVVTKVCNREFWERLRNDEHVYRCADRAPRGFAIVVNIKRVAQYEQERVGSEVDVAMIKNVFSQLHYKVVVLQDLKKQELKRNLEMIAQRREELQSHDSLFVFLMSHGIKNTIYCCDVPMDLNEIYRIFGECSALHNKPKVFVIQACRTDLTRSTKVVSDGPTDQKMFSLFEPQNTLLAYSTISGGKSFRDTEEGSWYIKALIETFCDYADKEHVLDLMTRTNQRLKEMCERLIYDEVSQRLYTPDQCAIQENTFTKKFFLFPGML